MYLHNPSFEQPEDETLKLWRYMDFTKFISLLETRKLFFSRSDMFDDRFEGSSTKLNVQIRSDLIEKTGEDIIGDILQHLRKYVAINCWHENEHESAAMWLLYLKSNEGIVILSDWRRLKQSIIDNRTVHIGRVKYIDYETEKILFSHRLSNYLYKRKSFEHEKEVRAIVSDVPKPENPELIFDSSVETINGGVSVSVSLEVLIRKVYIAPTAPQWFFELVTSVVRTYGFNFEVIKSSIDSDPIY
jgi:hypothetical protein